MKITEDFIKEILKTDIQKILKEYITIVFYYNILIKK